MMPSKAGLAAAAGPFRSKWWKWRIAAMTPKKKEDTANDQVTMIMTIGRVLMNVGIGLASKNKAAMNCWNMSTRILTSTAPLDRS